MRRLAPALFAVLGSLPGAAPAQDAAATGAAGPPGSELTVYLMTMGQGDQIWERFGHNALGIRDSRANTDVVFNWGLFSFDEPGFMGRFLRGDMMYWMGGYDAAPTIVDYVTANRTVEIQELNLSPAQRVALLEFIRWNAREENRSYRYDYFLDNCSTRVRDVLDRVLGGALRQATDTVITTSSYRDQAKRLLWDDLPATIGVDIGLGRPTDLPLTGWEEMFIPMKVRDHVRTLRVPDETGALVPLVTSERVVFQATRAPERDRPPALLLPLLVAGVAIGGGLLRLGRRGLTGARGAGMAATAAMALWCLLVGVMGGALLYLRLLTHHAAAHDNTNIFVYNPAWLVVAALLPLARGVSGRTALHALATFGGAFTVVGLALLFVPGFNQDSLAVVLLAAPANLATAWLIRERTRVAAGPATG